MSLDFTHAEFYLEDERSKHNILKETQINTLPECQEIRDYYFIRLFSDGHSAIWNDKKKIYMKPFVSSKDRVYWRYGFQTKEGNNKFIRLHRLVGFAFISGYDKDTTNVINHIDLERPAEISQLDNSLMNIEWCTQEYNSQSENRRGNSNYKKGEMSDLSTLNISQNLSMGKGKNGLNYEKVEQIFNLKEQGHSLSQIAKNIGITDASVSLIINGKRWRDHPRSIEHLNKNKVI